ncbi:hypothetical protein [Moraxella sp. ZY210820]|uniref:hypothetical protein n=1 Tax=unclassified Moraxella TaxID=2685852 RepID=UPI0027309332|nr:hypothetical protein [Moraxella sp. ZY210820]WLF84493.1 hypothetical protein LU301_03185 [Moraxella sp. ZY210820]
MSKVKIMPQNFTGDVRQISVTGQQATFSVQDLPCEFVFNHITSQAGSDVAEVSNQTGIHHFEASNGFSATGSFDGIRRTILELGNDFHMVQKETGEWLIAYRGIGVVNVEIQAVSGGIDYIPILQPNTSIKIDGKNVRFSLENNIPFGSIDMVGDEHSEAPDLSLPEDGSYIITNSMRLTKQTGRHRIRTSNGFDSVGTIDELAPQLLNYHINLIDKGDEMVFENTDYSQDITVEIKAQGNSGKDYVATEQQNKSLVTNGRNAIFKLQQMFNAE